MYAISASEQLEVRAVPLQHYAGDENTVFDSSDFVDVDNPGVELVPWLPTLGISIAMDQPLLEHMRHDATKSNAHWTCPIRQMLLWSAQDRSFLPYIPNPIRASRLYGNIMTPYSSKMDVHPTSKAIPIDFATRLHTQYWTTNGFCIYKAGVAPSNEECALYALARSVLSTEYNNYTTVFADACLEQVDWPYPPTHGRDNSITPADASANCAVLDRLPHFQYRIRVDAPFQKSGKTTTDQPGVCHMGRSAVRPTMSMGNCWRVSETDTEVQMRCTGNITKILTKRAIKAPEEMIQDGMYKRQQCKSHCDAPPDFKGPDGTTNMPVPEVGYGRPFRWEMARMIAGIHSLTLVKFLIW